MRINHKKTAVLESLFNKFARLNYWILLELTRVSCWFSFSNHIQSNLKLHLNFLRSIHRKTSRVQRTLSTRKNWFAHINWMNGRKSKVVVRRCSAKILFWKISQNSQQNTWGPQLYWKRDSGTGVFLWI